MTRLLCLLLLTACSSEMTTRMADADDLQTGTTAIDTNSSQLRLDVFPNQLTDASGTLRALPRTEGPVDINGGDLDLSVIQLGLPEAFTGIVTGAATTPAADGAQVPNVTGPVDASVTVQRLGSVQHYETTTDSSGEFSLQVVSPTEDYLVSVVPEDPLIPFESRLVRVAAGGADAVFELGYGVPIFGRVVVGGVPLANAAVHAVNEQGIAGTSAHSDEDGWYLLRVLPGQAYTIVSTGRDHGRDPVLSTGGVFAEEDLGSRVDFIYPHLSGPIAFGRVVDTSGDPIGGVKVAFTAKALDGYDGLDASLAIEDTTDSNGNFEATLLDGTYRVEFLPPVVSDPALDHGPAMIADTSELAGMTFGTIELPDLVGFSGQIQDVSGNPIGGAGIHCTEVGFEQRTWSDFSNEEGRYALTLPPLPMTCTMIPPGDRTDLAWTSETIDTSIDEGHVFEIRTGIRASGTVRLRSEVEPFSVVEIRDGLGALLGAALTDQDGQFSAQVDVDPGLGAR